MSVTTQKGYYNFWKIEKPKVEEVVKFTDLEIALMEGGHSLEQVQIEKMPFIKMLKNTLP